MTSRSWLAVMTMALVLSGAGGCTSSPSDSLVIDDAAIEVATRTWVNQLGLAESDVDLWRDRLQRACDEGVWDRDVAEALAGEFIEADAATSIGSEGASLPTLHDGAQALWLMAVNICRDRFPTEAIDAGPP